MKILEINLIPEFQIYRLIFFLVIASVILSCSNDSNIKEESAGEIIPAVEAVKARYGSLPLTQRLSGIVEAKNQIAIYPEISAVIEEVYVKDGYSVKKGDPLVRLRAKEFKERLNQADAGYQIAVAQLKQAEARFSEIKSELRRTESLYEQGLSSPTELETMQSRAISAEADVSLAKARVKQAEATVEERNESLSQTIVKSPITGSVGNRNAEIGMLVTANTRLFTLGQLENVRVKVILTDRMLNFIKEGQRVEIGGDNGSPDVLNAELSRISPFLNPVTHSTEAEIDLENPDKILKSGMFVTVDIFYGESEQATLIPLSALYENPTVGGTGVYITDETLIDEPKRNDQESKSVALSNPVEFKFIPVDIIAKGRMEAGIRGIDPEKWVITLGQNLLGGEQGKARVRTVNWMWIEKLQTLQREDLIESLMKRPTEIKIDTVTSK